MEDDKKDDNEPHYYKYEDDTNEIKYYSGLGVSNTNEVQLIEDGIYWSEAVEENISPGLSDDLVQDEILALRSRTVQSLETPTWLKCGRDKNRFVTFSDGVHACARDREPDQQLVLGEVMSFYLARTLGFTNVPAVILSQVDPNHPMWRGSQGQDHHRRDLRQPRQQRRAQGGQAQGPRHHGGCRGRS